MDFSSSFKKSFKSHGRRISIENSEDPRHEQQPILSHHLHHPSMTPSSSSSSSDYGDRREVIVKVDGNSDHIISNGRDVPARINNNNNNQVWRDPSYDFWKDHHHHDTIIKNQNQNHNMPAPPPGFGFHPTTTSSSNKDLMIHDPPSKLIGQFLNKQRAAGVEMSLDVDLEMNELRSDHPHPDLNHTPNHLHVSSFRNRATTDYDYGRVSHSKDLRVSFQSPPLNQNYNNSNNDVIDIEPDEKQQHHLHRKQDTDNSSSDEDDEGKVRSHPEYLNRRKLSADANTNTNTNNNDHYSNSAAATAADDDAQVLRCTSVQRKASVLGRMKTKSRLMDPTLPERPERKSGMIGKSGPMKSGMLGRASGMLGRASGILGKQQQPDEDEDDPLFDEDLPEEYRKGKLNALTLLQWFSLVLIIAALASTLAIPKWKRRKLRGLQLWKWEVLILVLICGRLVSGWGIRIAVLLIERNFLLRKRVLYFVYGIRKAVQNCIWLGLVLIAWHYMFDQRVEVNNNFLRYVNKLMVCMLVATLLWLVKTLMVKVLASSFHVSTFFDRIQESLFNQYVIEMLSGPPVVEIKSIQDEEERTIAEIRKLQNAGATLPPDLRPPTYHSSKSGRMTGSTGGGLPPRPSRTLSVKVSAGGSVSKNLQDDPGITIDHLHRLNPKNISAWNMKRLINIVKHGVLSTLDEQIMGTTHHDESTTLIRSEFEAKVAARKIFRNVAKPRAKFIYLEDLMRFLREDEAMKALNIVEGSSESEKISKASLKNWVVNAFRERRALALTLNDTKTAVKKLHRIVNVIVGIIIVIICMVILGIATSKFLLFVSSQIVVVAFVFGNTCKTIFEAIIFVFVMHPFDVGDRCEIDGIQMVVEEMNILSTVFLRYDNQKIIFPNSTLSTKAINNYYRSPDMGDSVDFTVHIATPPEKITIMKQRIINYIESKKEHWYGGPAVVLMNIEDLTRLKMSVWIRHRMNHQDMGLRWQRRAALVEEMIKIFKELDMDFRLYPLDINVRSLPPGSPPPLNSTTRIPSTWSQPSVA